MALQLKYEIREISVDARPPEVHARANVLITTYDTAGNIVKQTSTDTPDYTWAQLPANIRADIIALRDDMVVALKARYGTTAVTMIAPQVGG